MELVEKVTALGWELITPLSEFKNQREKSTFRCPNGHIVSMLPYHVLHRAKEKDNSSRSLRGSGCPRCSGHHKTIDDLHEFAESKGWKCLSREYKTQRDEYIWQCPNGHEHRATFHYFMKAQCCHQCKDHPVSLHDLQNLACLKGGKCLSEQVSSTMSLVWWECAHGDQWRTNFHHAQCEWCAECTLLSQKIGLDS